MGCYIAQMEFEYESSELILGHHRKRYYHNKPIAEIGKNTIILLLKGNVFLDTMVWILPLLF